MNTKTTLELAHLTDNYTRKQLIDELFLILELAEKMDFELVYSLLLAHLQTRDAKCNSWRAVENIIVEPINAAFYGEHVVTPRNADYLQFEFQKCLENDHRYTSAMADKAAGLSVLESWGEAVADLYRRPSEFAEVCEIYLNLKSLRP